MKFDNLEYLKNFNENNLPSLCIVTLGALELFEKEGFSKVNIKNFKKPVIVGSGNAIVTAKILYENTDAIFADENNYVDAIKREGVDGVVIFSASGAKHAPIIAQAAKEKKIPTQLVTCTENSPAQKILGKENTIITHKNREPYTYNTSTYMGWIFAKTREEPAKIREFILKNVEPKIPKNLSSYNGFLLLTPNKFAPLNHLFEVKFIELFGRKIARDVKTFEETKHAITVVPSKTELCIKFGDGEADFSNDILKIDIPSWVGQAGMMAIAYFTIGKIQEQNKPYFFENISDYIRRLNSKDFGKGLKVIVE